MKTALRVVVSILLSTVVSFGQATTVFSGRPVVKISEAGIDRVPEQLSTEKATNLSCVISKINGKFYWASRENKELVRTESGAFVTFVAANGSGYIRIIKPELKRAAGLMSETEEKFDYVEHLVIGLRNVTYFGVARQR